jgi:hypothetical protein
METAYGHRDLELNWSPAKDDTNFRQTMAYPNFSKQDELEKNEVAINIMGKLAEHEHDIPLRMF